MGFGRSIGLRHSVRPVSRGKILWPTTQTWGLGEKVVLELLNAMPKGESYHVLMDNFFCSMRLLKFLGANNIRVRCVKIAYPKVVALPESQGPLYPDRMVLAESKLYNQVN